MPKKTLNKKRKNIKTINKNISFDIKIFFLLILNEYKNSIFFSSISDERIIEEKIPIRKTNKIKLLLFIIKRVKLSKSIFILYFSS